jgi:hypothetical protein
MQVQMKSPEQAFGAKPALPAVAPGEGMAWEAMVNIDAFISSCCSVHL